MWKTLVLRLISLCYRRPPKRDVDLVWELIPFDWCPLTGSSSGDMPPSGKPEEKVESPHVSSEHLP